MLWIDNCDAIRNAAGDGLLVSFLNWGFYKLCILHIFLYTLYIFIYFIIEPHSNNIFQDMIADYRRKSGVYLLVWFALQNLNEVSHKILVHFRETLMLTLHVETRQIASITKGSFSTFSLQISCFQELDGKFGLSFDSFVQACSFALSFDDPKSQKNHQKNFSYVGVKTGGGWLGQERRSPVNDGNKKSLNRHKLEGN